MIDRVATSVSVARNSGALDRPLDAVSTTVPDRSGDYFDPPLLPSRRDFDRL
jgi:hypothetical protein